MKRLLPLLALCAMAAMPVAAFAQQGPGMPNPPTPGQRAIMEKARADAKAGAYAALTPAHATSISAIVAQVTAGTLDRRAAATRIDALLTPDEQKGIMAAAAKARRAMRPSQMGAGAPPPRGGPPGGPPPPGPGRFGPPSAGRLLLMLSMTPQRRFTQPRARSTSAP